MYRGALVLLPLLVGAGCHQATAEKAELRAEMKKLEAEKAEADAQIKKLAAENAALRQELSSLRPGSKDALTRAKNDIKRIEQALVTFRVNNGYYPASLADLAERQPNNGKPLLNKQALLDPWGWPYQYDLNKLHPKTDMPHIYSPGEPGTNQTINNWEPN
jgi:cell division protein FtsB